MLQHLFRSIYLLSYYHNAVLMLWLGACMETTWLGLEKHHGLASNTCFGCVEFWSPQTPGNVPMSSYKTPALIP